MTKTPRAKSVLIVKIFAVIVILFIALVALVDSSPR